MSFVKDFDAVNDKFQETEQPRIQLRATDLLNAPVSGAEIPASGLSRQRVETRRYRRNRK
ncbi:MAG TPA: hypothetical protein DEF45_11215 [Rhodopirellula sp.]|nr:hypothetical protein [Rhodopirellula sp.]